MASIQDGQKNWPCTIMAINKEIIDVIMDGIHGYTAVTNGAARNGKVIADASNMYDISLPGTATEIDLNVRFHRMNEGSTLSEETMNKESVSTEKKEA